MVTVNCFLNLTISDLIHCLIGMYINFNLCVYVFRERSESHNAKLQRKLEKMNNEAEYTLQESKSTLEALEQTREINQKVYFVYTSSLSIIHLSIMICYKYHDKLGNALYNNNICSYMP